MQLYYLDTDSFKLGLDTNNVGLVDFLQQNKDEFGFSELDNNHELYDSGN